TVSSICSKTSLFIALMIYHRKITNKNRKDKEKGRKTCVLQLGVDREAPHDAHLFLLRTSAMFKQV
ncbi:MAG: hypothetical protein SPH23_00015, partial [Prevotella sp.]|nr:hypothetical protein [Prevotellaceae bacterium]MDY5249236.1 hypothetical protein [Prevotella sp.]